jgi:dihydrofolate reductase
VERKFKVCAIVAMDRGRIIGVDNKLPWHIPEDMKRFSNFTSGNTVIMGRKTYQSLPDKFRPLPNRLNVVITSDPTKVSLADGVMSFNSPQAAVDYFIANPKNLLGETLWVIGGAQIYQQMLLHTDEIYLTLVDGEHEGDVRLPEFERGFNLVNEEAREGYSFLKYVR